MYVMEKRKLKMYHGFASDMPVIQLSSIREFCEVLQ